MATTFGAGVVTRLDDARLDRRARLRSIQADPEQALREVYQWHHDRLVGYFVNRTHDRPLSEDLAHDTILRFAGALDNFDPSRSVWPYLRTIAGNVLVDHRRRASVQRAVDVGEEFADQPASGAGLDDTVVLRELLDRAVGDLPERQRIAVELRCERGWSVADAAVFLGIAPGAFSQLLFRAKENLKAALEESGARVGGLVAPVVLDLRLRTRGLAARARDVVQTPSTTFGVEALASVAVVATIGVTAAVGISVAGQLEQSSSQAIELVRQDVVPSALPRVVQRDQKATVGAQSPAPGMTSPAIGAEDAAQPPVREAAVIEAPRAIPNSGGNVTVADDEERFVVSGEVGARTGTNDVTDVGAESDAVFVSCGSSVGQLVCDGG